MIGLRTVFGHHQGMALTARWFSAVAAAGILLATGACASAGGDRSAPVRVETKGPAGSVPAGLDRFYAQSLGWGSCQGFATTADDKAAFGDKSLQCARLTVPLDYTQPDGRTITLGLLRRAATGPGPRVGSLVINPGGPGESGMSAAASLAGQTQGNALAARFDFVGFDPRGIAASQPQIRCLTDAEQDAKRLNVDVDTSPAGVAKTEAEEHDYVQKCAQRTGAEMLAHVGTRDVVQDMDVLRSVLGDPKLTYLGYSYGTRLGSSYAEQFPANVRAMVLDGAVDPAQGLVDQEVAQAKGFQNAFTQFTQWCGQQPNCALGKDPTQVVPAFRALVNPLVTTPAPTKSGRKLSYQDATTGVTQALYSKQLWQPLNQALTELSHGTGNGLLLLADLYDGRGDDGRYANTIDAFNAVRCVDDPRLVDRAVVQQADQQQRAAAPFLNDGRAPSTALDTCAFWPVPSSGSPHQPVVSGLPPVLVISTTNDPATPYQAGVELAKGLGGRLLTNEGEGHTAFLQRKKCVDDIGIAYLIDLTVPADGARCAP